MDLGRPCSFLLLSTDDPELLQSLRTTDSGRPMVLRAVGSLEHSGASLSICKRLSSGHLCLGIPPASWTPSRRGLRIISVAALNKFHLLFLPKYTSGQSLPIRKMLAFVNKIWLCLDGEATSLIHEFPLFLENFSLTIAPIPQYSGRDLIFFRHKLVPLTLLSSSGDQAGLWQDLGLERLSDNRKEENAGQKETQGGLFSLKTGGPTSSWPPLLCPAGGHYLSTWQAEYMPSQSP